MLKTSPYIFKHAKEPELDIDKKFKVKIKTYSKEKLKSQRDTNFPNYSKKHIQKGFIENKNVFNPGDRVMVYKRNEDVKLKSKWIEGFAIKQKLHDNAFI
ncbi:hypothetical protein COBT_004256, partial [Conglomerata obtusa]